MKTSLRFLGLTGWGVVFATGVLMAACGDPGSSTTNTTPGKTTSSSSGAGGEGGGGGAGGAGCSGPGEQLCAGVCTNTQKDTANCGTCGNDCADLPNVDPMSVMCTDGACVVTACAAGYADCNKDPIDGCETDITTGENCGACGTMCSDPDKPFCAPDGNNQYICTNKCPSGTPTQCGTSCVDTQKNTGHCGMCDNKCPDVSNGQPTCMGGMCGFTCNAGYMSNGTACVDIDECAANTDNCDANADCKNVPGSYTCICKMGYTGDGVMCNDVDECMMGTDNCSDNATCTNTQGSFTCMCKTGFTGNGVMCADVDECAPGGGNNCNTNANCTNTPGSFTCMCKTGYTGTGVMCTDVNECMDGTDNCSDNAACMNTPGSFNCTCNSGFMGNGTTCADINECTTGANNCSVDANCANTPGSFNCSCKNGYTGNGVTCTDVDECGNKTDNCDNNATCLNTPGSFTCTCKNGFAGDGVTCTDIDECALNTDNCDVNATCTNTPGSFTCACNAGYVGNGVMCSSSCMAPLTSCPDGSCVDLNTDPAHCGSCTNACTSGQNCVLGTCVGTGSLQLTLVWDRAGDMDLHLINPSTNHIYFGNTGPSSLTDFGQLDVDDQSGLGPENIYWATMYTPPPGTYTVCAAPYNISGATNFTLTIKRTGHTDLVVTGTRTASNTTTTCNAASPHFVTTFAFP